MQDDARLETLSELGFSFQKSRIFLTALELDFFTHIGDGPAKAAEVAARAGTDLRGTEILLNALVAIDLLTKSQGSFSNSVAARRFLVSGGPEYAGVGLKHYVNLWKSWSTLTDVLKSGKPSPRPADGPDAQASTARLIMLMHERAKVRAPLVADALDLSGVRGVLDVGGGPGTHSIEFARRNPSLCAVVFDLPEVVLIANRIIAEAGMQDRVTVKPGDYYADIFGAGYDLVFISAIIHSNGPGGNKLIFSKAYDALNPGGRIAIVDFIMNEDKAAPEFGALFAVNMLVGTEQGNCYSEGEVKDWLSQTGFVNTDIKRDIDEDISLMTAIRPQV